MLILRHNNINIKKCSKFGSKRLLLFRLFLVQILTTAATSEIDGFSLEFICIYQVYYSVLVPKLNSETALNQIKIQCDENINIIILICKYQKLMLKLAIPPSELLITSKL